MREVSPEVAGMRESVDILVQTALSMGVEPSKIATALLTVVGDTYGAAMGMEHVAGLLREAADVYEANYTRKPDEETTH